MEKQKILNGNYNGLEVEASNNSNSGFEFCLKKEGRSVYMYAENKVPSNLDKLIEAFKRRNYPLKIIEDYKLRLKECPVQV